jgi:acetyltransferase-like isoleucine patch superfamily enzyme
MKASFLTSEEIEDLNLLSVGENVKISRFARFYGNNIRIGNNVRIDDFCILSGEISIGSFVHISAYTALYGRFGIEIDDFAGLSPRCTVFSASDDFTGNFFIGPIIDPKYTNVTGGKVTIGKYSQIGAGCIILPQVTIEEGVAIGAMSLINTNIESWKIAFGIPARIIKNRSKSLLRFEKNILGD